MSAVSITDNKEGKSAGSILRETRESRGLSLDDAAGVTRIGKSHLHALEEGTYDRLPSEAYVKGFLRVYAAYLKLPENVVLRAYEKDLSVDGPCPVKQQQQPQIKDKNIEKSARRSKWLYMVPVTLALVAVSSYLLISPPDATNGKKLHPPPVPSPVKPAIPVAPPAETVLESADTREQEKTPKVKEENNPEIFKAPSPPSTRPAIG